MNKKELLEILKPLVRACIKEELTRSNGSLKTLITEVSEAVTSQQMKLLTETLKFMNSASGRTVITETSSQPFAVARKNPASTKEMIESAKSLMGLNQEEENPYVDVEQKFRKMNPELRELMKETQEREVQQGAASNAEWEPPPPIEQLLDSEGKIDPKLAGSLTPLRDFHPNDPGIDLDQLVNVIKARSKKN
jgi:uncharacterized coiled-coil protein SlyX